MTLMPKKRFLISLVALGYFATGWLTIAITGLKTAASPIWIPAALALTCLFLWGENLWLGVFLGDFLLIKVLGGSWIIALFSALGSSLAAFWGARMLKYWQFSGYLNRIRDVMALVFLGALLSSSLNASLDTFGYNFIAGRPNALQHWTMVWLGDSSAILVITPFLLRVYLEGRGAWRCQPQGRRKEAYLCMGLLLLVGSLVFGLEEIGVNTLMSPLMSAQYLEYLPFPFVMWAALRFQTWGAVTANFLLSLLALMGTLKGVGPFMLQTPFLGQSILLLQMFLAVVTTTSLFLASAVAEREKIEKQLRASLEREKLVAQAAVRVHQSLDLGAIFETTVEEIRYFLTGEQVYIAYLQDSSPVEIVAESLETGYSSLLGWIPDGDLIGEVTGFFRNTDLLVVNNTENFAELPILKEYFTDFDVKSALVLPLKVNKQPLGVLVVQQYSRPRHWQKLEVKLLEQLATQVSIAIEQAQLYQRLRRLNTNLEQEVEERTLEVKEKMQELTRFYDMKTVFFQAVSHDLRTSMMGLVMLLKNLGSQAGELVSLPRLMLDQVIQQSDRQLTLINALSEDHFSLQSSLVFDFQPLSLRELLTEIFQNNDGLLQQNQAQVYNQIPKDLPPIKGDKRLLSSAFNHLLTNALKHNPPGVTITLDAKVDKDMIYCSFIDDGTGMNEAQCQGLFKLYVRSLYNHRLTGIGLGSYQCRQIIEAHGGRIGVYSRLHEGTHVWLTLPIRFNEKVLG